MTPSLGQPRLPRRAFLQQGAILLAPAFLGNPRRAPGAEGGEDKPKLRIGLVTDLHYADKETRAGRYYRDSPVKLAEAARQFALDKVDLAIELGDVIDSAATLEEEKSFLTRIYGELKRLPGQRHCVLGNHCVESLTKAEFLEIVEQKRSFYSWDSGGYHFVILDACFRSDFAPYGRKSSTWEDANIPPEEAEWLRRDLQQTTLKTVVFVHQCLDVPPAHGVRNAPEIRRILEASGKVLAVVQGHYHRGNYTEIGGIHYCTLKAMVEGKGPQGNAFAVMDILPGDAIRIRGFGRQKSHELARR